MPRARDVVRPTGSVVSPSDLSPSEDLLAFLKSLTAEKVETPLPNLPN